MDYRSSLIQHHPGWPRRSDYLQPAIGLTNKSRNNQLQARNGKPEYCDSGPDKEIGQASRCDLQIQTLWLHSRMHPASLLCTILDYHFYYYYLVTSITWYFGKIRIPYDHQLLAYPVVLASWRLVCQRIILRTIIQYILYGVLLRTEHPVLCMNSKKG